MSDNGSIPELLPDPGLALDHCHDGIALVDGEARVVYCNGAYESLTGLSSQALLGRALGDLEAAALIRPSSALVCLARGESVTLPERYAAGNSAVATSRPVPGGDGRTAWVVTCVRDLDELHRLCAEQQNQEDRADNYRRELAEIRRELRENREFIAEDENMLALLHMAKRLAQVNATVLLLGETGVGKEELAQYIHSHSARATREFVKINCGALPENLIESELFGYEGGAFTGAQKGGKKGIFEEADGGTVFLDEIGELPHSIQVKLLRFLQEQEITRIGGFAPIKVDVRIITATNRDLERMVQEGVFRSDLYYRINVAPLTIPPLRERRGDIAPLAQAFCAYYNRAHGQNKQLSTQAIRELRKYDWPGNVRELRNMMERLAIIHITDVIDHIDLEQSREHTALAGGRERIQAEIDAGLDMKARLEQIELEYLEAAYQQYGNVRDAAARLSMDASTFVRKRQRYDKKYGG